MDTLLGSTTSLHDFGAVAKNMLTLLALCSARIYAAFFVLPATSDGVLQGVVRNGLCLVLGLFVALGQPLAWLNDLSAATLTAMLAKEALLGVLLGLAASTVFWVAEGAGMLIDNLSGYNNVQQTNPLSGEQSTPVGNLMAQLAIAGFYMLGGMVVLVGVMYESFLWWPLQVMMPDPTAWLETFVRLYSAQYLQGVLSLAAPVLLVLVLIDLGIGFIGKTAEKLEPNSLAQPIKGAVTLLLLSLLVALFFEQARPQLALHHLANDVRQWMQVQPSR